jgi:hypothetical protein
MRMYTQMGAAMKAESAPAMAGEAGEQDISVTVSIKLTVTR